MARKNFSKAIIARRFAHAGGRCEAIIEGKRCNAVLVPGKWQCDHDTADGLLGEPTFENARALCADHHANKTKRDVEAIARAKRVEMKALRPIAPPSAIKSAPLPTTERAARRQSKPPVLRQFFLYRDVSR
jgi:hypothetical protein